MDIANSTGFPSAELQMSRITQGALGRTVDDFNAPQQVAQEPMPEGNLQSNITAAELERLRGIETMVSNGELISKYGSNQNDPLPQQKQEDPSVSQDQGGTDDWMAQFDTGNDRNEYARAQPWEDTPQKTQVDTNPQNDMQPSETEIVLMREGAKNGISGDAMIDFARQLEAKDYLMLYQFKKDQAAKVNANSNYQANTPIDNQVTPGSQTYQPRYFDRNKPTPGPSIAELTGSDKRPETNFGVPKLAGTGAMKYNI